jgi:hypothetical protein
LIAVPENLFNCDIQRWQQPSNRLFNPYQNENAIILVANRKQLPLKVLPTEPKQCTLAFISHPTFTSAHQNHGAQRHSSQCAAAEPSSAAAVPAAKCTRICQSGPDWPDRRPATTPSSDVHNRRSTAGFDR